MPNAIPGNVNARHSGPYEANVTWIEIPPLNWRALSITYKVSYKKQGSGSFKSEFFPGNSAKLKNLEPNSTYVVQVSGSNSAGDGKKSEEVVFSTISCMYFMLHAFYFEMYHMCFHLVQWEHVQWGYCVYMGKCLGRILRLLTYCETLPRGASLVDI